MPTTYHCEQGFSALVEIKWKKANSIKDVNRLMKNVLETGLKTTFFTTSGWNSAGTITANEMISFFSYCVLYKLHEQEDWLSLFLVLRVPCPAIFCVVAATCETHMWMAARPMTEIHIQIKPKIALKTKGYWVSLLSKENPQLLPQIKHTL